MSKKENFHNKEIGKNGEELACKYLEKNDYEILERNFFTGKGEIDIIARIKNEYVFIEVKTRISKNFGQPIEAVDEHKKKNIIKASKFYIYLNSLENKYIRFDIIEVYINKNNSLINHIKNVFF